MPDNVNLRVEEGEIHAPVGENGAGTVGGAPDGALTMGMIKNGISIMGMQQSVQQVALGLVLLAAVIIDIVSKSGTASLPFFSRLGGSGKKKTIGSIQK